MKILKKYRHYYPILLALILLLVLNGSAAAAYFRSNLSDFVKTEGQITVPIFVPTEQFAIKTESQAILISNKNDKIELNQGQNYFISQAELELAEAPVTKTKKSVWGVQVVASSDLKKAEALKVELTNQFEQAKKLDFEILKEADLYKLVVGSYEQRQKAEALQEELESAGFKGWPRQFVKEIITEPAESAVSKNGDLNKLRLKKGTDLKAEPKSLKLYNLKAEKLKEAYTFKLKGDFQIAGRKMSGQYSFGPLAKSVLFSYKTDLEELTAYLLQKYCKAETDPKALQAQAIIYRTNLLYQLEVKGARLTNLIDLNFGSLKTVFKKAAAATEGEVLTKSNEFYYNSDFSLKQIKKPKAGLIALAKTDYDYQEMINYYYRRAKIENLNELLDSEQTVEARIKRGLKFREIRQLSWSGPRVLTVLDLDLNSDNLKLKPVLAQGKTIGKEDLRSLIKKHSALAGVNGSYFDGQGTPLGLVYLEGELVSEPLYQRSSLLIGPQNQIAFAQVDWSGKIVIGQAEKSIAIDGINRKARAGELIVFNHYYGAQMPPLAAGELDLIVRNQNFLGLETETGKSSPIPANGFVLRIPAVESLQKKLKPQILADQAQEFSLEHSFEPDFKQKNILSALGGGPQLLKAGKIEITGQAENFQADILTGRAPRTAVALTADNHLLLLTIDGRQSDLSVGMTLRELAKILQEMGAVSAINLDGGGSARMVIRNFTMSNPSEKRLISNGILVGEEAEEKDED